MSINLEKIANGILVLVHPRGGFVLRVGIESMLELMPVFELERSCSNGPAWGALIEYVISSDPRMSDYKMDSEGLAWSERRKPLDQLRSILLEAAAEPQKLRELIREGRSAGFGFGDL